ncbi:hypothetical protein AB0420_33780 [Streptomyces caelestis]|uniref:Uncharacterized protein n=1 Tax=Streptomyces heliomycini TaxID=284032 RepID=A0ABV5L479_9ACTN|nr:MULTISPECIES: hypothetical protein [Streptomyces]
MSSIVRFFVASPSDATASRARGPNASLRSVTYGNFDAEEALLDWESRLTGGTFDRLLEGGGPEVVAEDEGGPTVFLLSDALLGELASLSDVRIGDTAAWWTEKKARDGFPIDLPVALRILQDVVRLVREERPAGENVYCWTG